MARATLPLPSQIYLRECLDYDPISGSLMWRRRPKEHFRTERLWLEWNGRSAERPAGDRLSLYPSIRLDGVAYRLYRIAWVWVTGEDPGDREIDHINRDPQDNRFCNLRLSTHRQNHMNRSAQANNSTGLKGVFPHRKGWSAQIKVGDTRHHLGTYDTPEAAHAAYCAASERLHGAFGRTE